MTSDHFMLKKTFAAAAAAASIALGAAFVPQAAEASHSKERFVAFCEYMAPSGLVVAGPVNFETTPGRAEMVWQDGFRRILYWDHGYAVDDVGDIWIDAGTDGRVLYVINERTGAQLYCVK